MATYNTTGDTGSQSNTILQDRVPVDISSDITRKLGPLAPFTLMLESLSQVPTIGKKHEWMERDDLDTYVTTVADNGVTTTITLTTAEANKIQVNDILYFQAGPESMLVTAVNYGSGAVTVVRGLGDTSPSAINGTVTPVELIITGNAMEEWSTGRKLISIKPEAKYNYIQGMRNPFGVSGRLGSMDLIGPSEMEFLNTDLLRKHYREKENTLLFGAKEAIDDQTFSGGIYDMALSKSGSYSQDASGTLSLGEFLDFLEQGFYYGSTSKLLMCGSDVIRAINGFAYDKLEVNMELSEYGLNVQTFNAPDGSANIMRHKAFDEMGMRGEAWLVDLEVAKMFGLNGRMNTALNTGPSGKGIQNNDVDGTIYEWVSEFGLEIRHPERHSRLYGCDGTSSTTV